MNQTTLSQKLEGTWQLHLIDEPKPISVQGLHFEIFKDENGCSKITNPFIKIYDAFRRQKDESVLVLQSGDSHFYFSKI